MKRSIIILIFLFLYCNCIKHQSQNMEYDRPVMKYGDYKYDELNVYISPCSSDIFKDYSSIYSEDNFIFTINGHDIKIIQHVLVASECPSWNVYYNINDNINIIIDDRYHPKIACAGLDYYQVTYYLINLKPGDYNINLPVDLLGNKQFYTKSIHIDE